MLTIGIGDRGENVQNPEKEDGRDGKLSAESHLKSPDASLRQDQDDQIEETIH